MVDMTISTVATAAERAAATSYLHGQTSTGPIVDRRYALTDFMTLNANSHYQIGTTALSWFSGAKALQVGNGAVWGVEATNGNEIEIGSNYYQSVAGTYNYSAAGKARLIRLRDTEMGFYRAATGAANGAITWLQDITIDNSGNFLVKGIGCLGYGTGAGGTVTQATSKATPVTLSKACGQIVTNAASLASNTTVLFTVTNTLVAATDVIDACRASGGTAGAYNVWVDSVAAGSYVIAIRNTTGGSLSEAITINVVLTKSVTS